MQNVQTLAGCLFQIAWCIQLAIMAGETMYLFSPIIFIFDNINLFHSVTENNSIVVLTWYYNNYSFCQ